MTEHVCFIKEEELEFVDGRPDVSILKHVFENNADGFRRLAKK